VVSYGWCLFFFFLRRGEEARRDYRLSKGNRVNIPEPRRGFFLFSFPFWFRKRIWMRQRNGSWRRRRKSWEEFSLLFNRLFIDEVSFDPLFIFIIDKTTAKFHVKSPEADYLEKGDFGRAKPYYFLRRYWSGALSTIHERSSGHDLSLSRGRTHNRSRSPR